MSLFSPALDLFQATPHHAWLLAVAALIGGLVRGFTGFGFAMVFMPLASLAVGPVAALALIWVIDAPFAAVLAARSGKRADWREILPLLAAATLMLPVGVWLLTSLDRITMRWLLAGVVLLAVAILASGWRYAGRPSLGLTLGTGAASGLFSGLASLGGMPLAVFWLGAQKNNPQKTRDNLQTYFALATVVSGLVYWWNGILTFERALLALPLLVPYGLALLVGAYGFRIASEATFRRIAYVVIALSALVAMPAWDGLVGR
jgi:uncharacterized protein